MSRRTLWVRCPACDSKLEVDERDGRVLRQQRGGRSGQATQDDDWAAAVARAQAKRGAGEDKLEAALARERSKEDELDDLFRNRVGGLRPGDPEPAGSREVADAAEAGAWEALAGAPDWRDAEPCAPGSGAPAEGRFLGLESVLSLSLEGLEIPELPQRWRTARAEGDLQPIWNRVLAEGLAERPEAAPSERLATAFAGRVDLDLVLAEQDGQPAAAGALLRAGTWAVFCAAATRSGQAGRGGYLATFVQRLRWAQAAGAEQVVTACAPGSSVERIWLRSGARRLGHRALIRVPGGN
ncbi:MAG: hypothetical protein ACYS26_11500 [Planctomycetota bacterium]|jgi:hypothetical protein